MPYSIPQWAYLLLCLYSLPCSRIPRPKLEQVLEPCCHPQGPGLVPNCNAYQQRPNNENETSLLLHPLDSRTVVLNLGVEQRFHRGHLRPLENISDGFPSLGGSAHIQEPGKVQETLMNCIDWTMQCIIFRDIKANARYFIMYNYMLFCD